MQDKQEAIARNLQPEDPVKKLAERLRGKGGLEWRSAVLQDQRVEAVRGKDFAAYFRQHEDLLQQFVSKSALLGRPCMKHLGLCWGHRLVIATCMHAS